MPTQFGGQKLTKLKVKSEGNPSYSEHYVVGKQVRQYSAGSTTRTRKIASVRRMSPLGHRPPRRYVAVVAAVPSIRDKERRQSRSRRKYPRNLPRRHATGAAEKGHLRPSLRSRKERANSPSLTNHPIAPRCRERSPSTTSIASIMCERRTLES